jgi:hypothetical protein
MRTRICSFVLDQRGFVYAKLDAGAYLELEDAREAIAATWLVAGERRLPVLVDMTGVAGQARVARLYFVSDEAVARYSAVAIVVGSPVSRVVGTFFMKLSEHKVPTRLFSDLAEAERFLVDQVR